MLMEAARRCFNEKELEMMLDIDVPVWRWLGPPNASVQFTVNPREYYMDSLVSMFSTENVGFPLKQCRMIMLPATIESIWGLYVLDRHLKRLNVLDPTYTDQDESSYEAKHGDNARHVLHGVATVGRAMDDDWQMREADWQIAYNMGMHEPCEDKDSGACIIHYALNFDGHGLEELIVQGVVSNVRKSLHYQIVAMDGNDAPKPGFMQTEEADE